MGIRMAVALILPTSSWPNLKKKSLGKVKQHFLSVGLPQTGNFLFIEQANKFHPTIKFMAQISEIETTFLDTIIILYKGD